MDHWLSRACRVTANCLIDLSDADRLRSCWGLLCAGSLPCFQIAPLEKSRQPGLYLNSIVIFRHRFGNLIEPCHCGPRRKGALTPEENGKMNDSQQEHEFERVSSQNEITPALLHAWRSRMRRWCARELGGAYASRMDTSDVVQESLLQVWQDWDRFRGNSSGEVKSWMFRIAKGHLHKARRHHRAAKRSVFIESGEMMDIGHGEANDPSDVAEQSEARLNLMIAINQLEPELREVIHFRIFGQQSYIEVGEELGISKSEARNRFLRAIRKLKHLIDDPSAPKEKPR